MYFKDAVPWKTKDFDYLIRKISADQIEEINVQNTYFRKIRLTNLFLKYLYFYDRDEQLLSHLLDPLPKEFAHRVI